MVTPRFHSLTQELSRTLAGLEAGLRVRHVATTPLKTCAADTNVSEAFPASPNDPVLDQLGVTDGSRTIGVVERPATLAYQLVRDLMRPLDDEVLVSGDLPLLRFIPMLARPPTYRLVIMDERIDGIVTRSDLLKLPVRVLVFTHITHLELVMAEYIRTHYPKEEDWLVALHGRRKSVDEKFEMLQRARAEIDRLECTEFCDKSRLVKNKWDGSKSQFKDAMKRIQRLRDSIAHASTFVERGENLFTFIEDFKLTSQYTEGIGAALSGAQVLPGK